MINKTKLAVCTAPISITDDSFGDFTYEWIIPAANDSCLLASGQEESAWGGGIVDHGAAPQQECEFLFDAVDAVQKADALDYSIAAASGLLCSLIDIFWVGKFNLAEAEHWGKEKASQFVLGVAQSKGYKGETLAGAIRFLEKAFPIPADLLTSEFGGGLQHHLRDFGHHPTLLGLFFSLLTQFTGLGFGTDTEGSFIVCKLPDQAALGKTIHEKIFNGIITWAFHLISDLAGSSSSPGAGTGIPGPLLATLKELSALPLIHDIKIRYCKPGHNEDVSFSAFVSKLFNGTYFMNQDGSNRVPLGHLFELYRYGDSYIIYGELDIIRVEANFETSWVFSGSEIFVTMDDQAPFEMSNDRIILRDWDNNYYEVDYNGNLLVFKN